MGTPGPGFLSKHPRRVMGEPYGILVNAVFISLRHAGSHAGKIDARIGMGPDRPLGFDPAVPIAAPSLELQASEIQGMGTKS